MNGQTEAMKIAIMGAGGRMGRMLIESIFADQGMRLVSALEQIDAPGIGKDAGELVGAAHCGVAISTNLDAGISAADCLIDFTRPEGSLTHLEYCVRHKVAMVIGTTGFDEKGKEAILNASHKIPVVFSPNMSVGVNVVFKLLDTASRILADDYDVEIFEAHHRLKVDAPSGTALRMGEVIANAQNRQLKDCAVFDRTGITGQRTPASIGFSCVRGGDIIGDHSVMYCGMGERIEINHKSSSRVSYALGALRAVRFLAGKENGLFDMQDVLGLR